MKLEVGMYVRTDKGEIKRIFQYNEQEDNLVWCTLNCYATIKGSILKASHNIIDLIEEGDILKYVYDNKECVSKVLDRGSKMLLVTAHLEVSLGLVDIKSIVTKEQFESMSYKVGE